MATLIFWKDNFDKTPKKKGVVGGLLWDQFIVNAENGHGETFFVDCLTANEGRRIIQSGRCKVSKHKNVFFFGDEAEKALGGST